MFEISTYEPVLLVQ